MPAPSEPAPRVRLAAAQRRSQLLDVAGALFAEHGYHGLSMESIADAAGVSKPVLYQHFPSKRDLYLALVTAAAEVLEARVTAALAGTRDNRERVHRAIGAFFEFVADQRSALVLGAAADTDADVRAVADRSFDRISTGIGQLIAEDAGLDTGSATLLATAIQGLATDGARRWSAAPEHVDKDEAVRLLARLTWRGLGAFSPDDEAPEHDQPERT